MTGVQTCALPIWLNSSRSSSFGSSCKKTVPSCASKGSGSGKAASAGSVSRRLVCWVRSSVGGSVGAGPRRAVTKLAPRRGSALTEPPTEDLTQQTSLLDTEPAEAAFPLPEPLLAQDGTVFLHELPKELLRLLFSLQAPLQDWLEANPETDAHAQLLELYFAVQDITRAAERYDEMCIRDSLWAYAVLAVVSNCCPPL